MPREYRVLVVDDEPEVARFVCDLLAAQGHRTRAVTSGDAATHELEKDPVDVVITDLRMGEVSGLDLIAWIKRFDPRIAVIAITAFGSIDTAIRAIKLGAFDYVTKPFPPEALLLAVEKATRERQMRVELVRLREAVDRAHAMEGLVVKSRAMQEIVELARRVAATPTAVLLTGANGTGKQSLARAIHAASSRRSRPFLSLSCSALPEAVLEEEIFGREGGAPGALREAYGGTVLLSEIAALPPALQGRLLRVLEAGELRPAGAARGRPVDVRVMASSEQDLTAEVESRAFREDLYYRLRVVEFRLPPLRDRPEDIAPLAEHFLARFAEKLAKKVVGFAEGAHKQLASYAWPGNVRELENVVERAVALCEHNVVRPDDLPDLIRTRPDTDFLAMAAAREMTLADLERAYMLRVLERTGGNKLRAAQILGIDRKTIYRWLGGQAEAQPAEKAAGEA